MIKLTYDDVLLVPQYNDVASRKDTFISLEFLGRILDSPIISANMDTISGAKFCIAISKSGGIGCMHRFMSPENNSIQYKKVIDAGQDCIVSVGFNDVDRFNNLYDAGARLFCIDVAHGHCKQMKEWALRYRELHPDCKFIGGNVVTEEGALFLQNECKMDAIKIGIGCGSVCSTRLKTGHGYPQYSAVKECAARVSIPVIADGGINEAGDIAKALKAGATCVMIGGMFAGSTETPGQFEVRKDGIPIKVFRGMASEEAQRSHMGKMDDWKTAEGISTEIKLQGPVRDVMNDLMGGLRSALTYSGSKTVQEFRNKSVVIQITSNGVTEGRTRK